MYTRVPRTNTGPDQNRKNVRNEGPARTRTEKILEILNLGPDRVIELRHEFRKILLTSAKINFGTRKPFALCRS